MIVFSHGSMVMNVSMRVREDSAVFVVIVGRIVVVVIIERRAVITIMRMSEGTAMSVKGRDRSSHGNVEMQAAASALHG